MLITVLQSRASYYGLGSYGTGWYSYTPNATPAVGGGSGGGTLYRPLEEIEQVIPEEIGPTEEELKHYPLRAMIVLLAYLLVIMIANSRKKQAIAAAKEEEEEKAGAGKDEELKNYY